MKVLPLTLILILLSTAGCKNKYGCTDPQAENYDPEAKENTGCEYQLDFTIWMNQQTSQAYQNDGVLKFKAVQLNNGGENVIGYFDVTDYSTSTPACGEGALTYSEKVYSRADSYYYSGNIYKITATDTTWVRSMGISSGPMNMFGNCQKLELTY